jgi:hypothetical protein
MDLSMWLFLAEGVAKLDLNHKTLMLAESKLKLLRMKGGEIATVAIRSQILKVLYPYEHQHHPQIKIQLSFMFQTVSSRVFI